MKRKKINGAFLGSVSTLMIGTLISQAIPILSSPILTRLYTPEEFGVLALFMSIGSVFSVFANFRFDVAIMSSDNETEQQILKRISILFTVFFSIILLICAFLFQDVIIKVTKIFDLEYFILVIPIFVFLSGILQLYTYIANKNGKYKSIAISKIIKNLSTTIIQLVFSTFNKGFFILILSVLGGFFFGLLNLLPRKLQSVKNSTFEEYKKTVLKYKAFPLVSSGTAFLDKVSVEAPVILLNRFYNSSEVGYFDIIRRTIASPLSIISYSVSQVYFKKIVELKEQAISPLKLTIKILWVLGVISTIVGLIISFFGEGLFAFVYGEEWRVAGQYSNILVFAFLIRFIVSPLSVVFLIPGNIKYGAIWQILYMLTTLVTSFYFLPMGIGIFIIAFTIHELILYIFYLIMILFVIIRK